MKEMKAEKAEAIAQFKGVAGSSRKFRKSKMKSKGKGKFPFKGGKPGKEC